MTRQTATHNQAQANRAPPGRTPAAQAAQAAKAAKAVRGGGFRVPRLRLLPLVIFGAVLMLSVRLGELWLDVEGLMLPVAVEQSAAHAGAEGTDVTGLAPPRNAPPRLATPDAAAGPIGPIASVGEQVAQAAPEENPNLRMGAPAPAVDPLTDPTSFTQNEIDLLQRLAERREMIESRERELATREGLLRAAEGRIDTKIAELRNLEVTIRGLVEQHDQQELERLDQLVRIYATMKPKDAARIFDQLDMPILIAVMERMRESKSAPIFAAMDVNRARALTEELTTRRRMPLPGEEG